MEGDCGKFCEVNRMENIQHSTFNIQHLRRSVRVGADCWRRRAIGLFVFLNIVSALLLVAQNIPASKATGNRFRYYYGPPNETQIKARVTVSTLVAGGTNNIQATQLHIETFTETGELESVIDAPECVYDDATHTASSAGFVKARTGDGRVTMEGTGFLLTLSNMALTISNNVRTVYGAPVKLPKKL
jgi:hypothetical protein